MHAVSSLPMDNRMALWWRKRTSEREALNRALLGVTVRTELEIAVAEMRRAFDELERTYVEEPPADAR